MKAGQPKFGPGGNGDWFKRDGGKATVQAPGWLRTVGLDAYEYEAGQGVSASESILRAVGNKAAEHGIAMSIHAPYFISLSGIEEDKRLKSIDYIQRSLWAAELLGAKTIVIHSGSCAKLDRSDAMRLSCDTLAKVMDALGGDIGRTGIRLGIETMGKVNQLGTLDEVIEQCRVDRHFHPVVDFGHINARVCGGAFLTADDYRRVFDTIANSLGDEYAKELHCHFSKIEWTQAGEKKHLTFEDETYGPEFEPLMEAIYREGLSPTIICESAGTQAEDALSMKKYYNSLSM